MLMKLPLVLLSLSFAVVCTAQEAAKPKAPAISECKYSCPLYDASGAPLVKKASAFGWDFDGYFVDGAVGRAGRGKGRTKGRGWYDVFECVYNPSTLDGKEYTCSYYKHDGTHALGYAGDGCPPLAPSCSATASTPILGPITDEDHESSAATDPSSPPVTIPHFSSSQLSNAKLVDPEKGVYKYRDSMETPAWVQEQRFYIYKKEFPPTKLD